MKKGKRLFILIVAIMVFWGSSVIGLADMSTYSIDTIFAEPAIGLQVRRAYGNTRCDTSYAVADELKNVLGVEKFDTVVVACAMNFPDALSGCFLASIKNAPMLLAKENHAENLRMYIRENLVQNGTIYVLGGSDVVPDSIFNELKKQYTIIRLEGETRYKTNLAILNEAEITDEDILICTGNGYADSLSASATGRPILLVSNKLSSAQKEFLEKHSENQYYIVGGDAAISNTLQNEIEKYVSTERLEGDTRYETSIIVAEKFFDSPSAITMAYAKNFPDGLCGGPLAEKMNAPLVLTSSGKESYASEYVSIYGIKKGIAFGGPDVLSDDVFKNVFNYDVLTMAKMSVDIDQHSTTVTDIRQSLSGTFEIENAVLDKITCTAFSSEFPENEYEIGEMYIDENAGVWQLTEIRLYPGANDITITIYDKEGNTSETAINLQYDDGTLAEYDGNEESYFDGGSGIGYINDVILCVIDANEEYPELILEEICTVSDGALIGQSNASRLYQIRVAKQDYESLVALCEKVQQIEGVIAASCDMITPSLKEEPVVDIDGEGNNGYLMSFANSMTIPKDPWKDVFEGFWGQDWDEDDPSGLNWWAEAVKAPSAWNYSDKMKEITIGIADAGVDNSHKDLNISKMLTKNVPNDHGTHVAGVIGAIANNEEGITGMVWNKKIYTYDLYQGEGYTSKTLEGIESLIQAGAKVINDSNGASNPDRDYEKEDVMMTALVMNWEKLITDDFLIVQAAGNDSMDSRYNGAFCTVTDEEALEHIMIVASVNQPRNSVYKLRHTSNYGPWITIGAPGENIFSTIVSGGSDGDYGEMSGTSMAAPIVTGVASMVWSINEEFTSAEVKEILLDTATREVEAYHEEDQETYYMVDAYAAVEEAVMRTYDDGTVNGCFVDALTGEGMQVDFSVYTEGGDSELVYSGTSDAEGYFQFDVPAGDYVIEAYGEDFITCYTSVKVYARACVSMGDIPISTEANENTYRIVLEWGSTPYDLDSHLVANTRNGLNIHVYYSDSYYEEANLDIDDTDSYGPETITVTEMTNLDGFTYCVHNYSDKDAMSGDSSAYYLSQSNAIVKVYKANMLIATYEIPKNRAGTVWNVFSIDKNGRIKTINSLDYVSDPSYVGESYVSMSVGQRAVQLSKAKMK